MRDTWATSRRCRCRRPAAVQYRTNCRRPAPYAYITVSDDIAEVFRKSENTEKAYYKKKKRNKAYYSLDADPSLESHILGSEPSPMVLYEQKHLRMALYQAMEHLSEKQYRRLSAHLFQRMSISEIAHAEGISKASIQDSIEQALRTISKILVANSYI